MFARVIQTVEEASRGRMALLLVCMVLASHGACDFMGVRFDDGPLLSYWQYLDPELLENDLVGSCLHLHSQPPLFNLFLGCVLKLFPRDSTAAFHGLYTIFALMLILSVFSLLQRMGVSRTTSLVLCTLFMLSPSFVLYGHWLFYTFPLALILVLSAILFFEVLQKGGMPAALGFFFFLFLLCGIRSLFHLLYYCFVAGFLLAVRPGTRRRILAAACVPFLLVTALYLKNTVLFGTFSVTSWTGMSFWATTVRNLPLPERQAMVDAGVLSPISLIERFSPLDRYPDEFINDNGFDDVPALACVKKSTGFDNYNHLAYIAIADRYMDDAVDSLSRRPKAFLTGLARSWFSYFKSSHDTDALSENRAKISTLGYLYDYLFYGKIPCSLSTIDRLPIYSDENHYLYLFLLPGLPLLVVCALGLASGRSRASVGLDRNQRMLILYVCFNIVYVALVGNCFEVGENNRFRFMTDPFYLVLLGLFLQRFLIPRFIKNAGLRLE